MADRRALEAFLHSALKDPDLAVTEAAADRLGGFDLSWLDRLPAAERAAVVGAFVAGLPPRPGPPGPPPIPGEFAVQRAPRRIDGRDIDAAAASLKRMLDARGIEAMSPAAQAIFLRCDCWPT